MTIQERTIRANGLDMHVLEMGEGPLAICLHGFPDLPWSLAPQIEALAAAGYHVAAPFLRGYAPTAIPADGRYQGAVLAQDVAGLIEALGGGPAVIVGHDWGASIGYATAVLFPHLVHRLVTLAVPYGPGMRQAMVADPVQQRRSWYMYLFVSPLGVPALAADDFALVDRLWQDWSPGWQAPPSHLVRVKAMFRQPGVAEAAVTFYRHSFRADLRDPALTEQQARLGHDPVTVPALYLHGADDGCVGADAGGNLDGLFTAGLTRLVIPGAGHFLHMEQPAAVNAAILSFLQ